MSVPETIVTWLLAGLFVLAGAFKFHPRTQIDAERWGYPVQFLQVVGVVEIAAAIALFWYPCRASAALLVIMAGALGTTYRHRNYKELIHPTITAALLFFVLLQNL